MNHARPEVFISLASRDISQVEPLADAIIARNIDVWLYSRDLEPGDVFQTKTQEALLRCDCVVVCVGPDGLGPWQKGEVDLAIDRRLRDPHFRVIPLLLPKATDQLEALPPFLKQSQAVSLDEQPLSEVIRRLETAILGVSTTGGDLASSPSRRNPYVGLTAFTEKDAGFFFGRENDAARLYRSITGQEPHGGTSRFVGVVGPSGSGKSSLIHAGLVPLIQAAAGLKPSWHIVRIRPGIAPLHNLARVLASLSTQQAPSASGLQVRLEKDRRQLAQWATEILEELRGARLLLVVDQFEELFTLCEDPAHRTAFIESILFAATCYSGPITVVVGMRADYYAECAHHESLARAIGEHHFLVSHLTDADLRRAIELPAGKMGVSITPAVVDRLVLAAHGQTGALPFLQHALFELWARRRDGEIGEAAYQDIGGLEGAIEQRAEQVFLGLQDADRALCRQLLLALIQPRGDSDPTKKRIEITELRDIGVAAGAAASAVDGIVRSLTAYDSRLLTAGGDDDLREHDAQIEISHEALIRAWGRYRRWIEDDIDHLKAWHRAKDAARDWEREGQKPDLLLRGARLAAALEIDDQRRFPFTPAEHGFLDASRAQKAVEDRLSDAAHLDQLEQAAPGVWEDAVARRIWLNRAERLCATAEMHRNHLASLRVEGTNEEKRFQREAIQVFLRRLEDFEIGLLFAARHRHSYPSLDPVPESAWDTAIAAVRTSHPELRNFGRQHGLAPLGLDPQSGLHEFAHLASGTVPCRSADGRLTIDERTCIVLVLIPGGEDWLGASSDSSSPNFDPDALPDESPVFEVRLGPYLISKYPITQGQYLRLSGKNPSMFRPLLHPGVSYLNPAECLDWNETMEVLKSSGLTLPTEAQWEFAVRAGTDWPWCIASSAEELAGKANLSESVHSSVTRFDEPNAWGVHEAIGNVWEWCLDDYAEYRVLPTDGRGYRHVEGAQFKTSRGGSFFNNAAYARSATRYYRTLPTARFNNRGARAARLMDGFEYERESPKC